MHVQFRCPNDFVDDQGIATPCRRRLRAPKSKSGRMSKCPRCGSPVAIPVESAAEFLPDHFTASEQEASAPLASGIVDQVDVEIQYDDFDDPVIDGAARTGAIKTNAMANSMANSRVNPQTQNYLPLDSIARCGKCGGVVGKNGVCTSCGFSNGAHTPNNGAPIEDVKIKTTGMHLWLNEIVSEGVPPQVLAIVFHALFFASVVVLSLVVYFLTTGLFFILAGALVAFLSFLYVGTVLKMREFRQNRHAQLAWYQRLFWDTVLWCCRKNKWANSKKPNRKIIDQKYTSLTDGQLDKLKDLKLAAVLDLEGTKVTDEAFRFFYRMERLECLVLKNTDTSRDSVFRLQQQRPKLWIWY